MCLRASVEGQDTDFSTRYQGSVGLQSQSEKMHAHGPLPSPTHPLTLSLYSGSPGFRFQTLTLTNDCKHFSSRTDGDAALTCIPSRLPLGFTFWQDLCRGRTVGSFLTTAANSGRMCLYPSCLRLHHYPTPNQILQPRGPAAPSQPGPYPTRCINPKATITEELGAEIAL